MDGCSSDTPTTASVYLGVTFVYLGVPKFGVGRSATPGSQRYTKVTRRYTEFPQDRALRAILPFSVAGFELDTRPLHLHSVDHLPAHQRRQGGADGVFAGLQIW